MSIGAMEEAAGGRRSSNSEINMVPMIDLLMCLICFLLITAVWSTWARVEANAPGGPQSCGDCGQKKPALHIMARSDDSFSLSWRDGSGAVLRTAEVPRVARPEGRAARLPELAEAISREWSSRPDEAREGKVAEAVLHVDHRVPFAEMAAVMDAILAPKTDVPGSRRPEPVFFVRLAN